MQKITFAKSFFIKGFIFRYHQNHLQEYFSIQSVRQFFQTMERQQRQTYKSAQKINIMKMDKDGALYQIYTFFLLFLIAEKLALLFIKASIGLSPLFSPEKADIRICFFYFLLNIIWISSSMMSVKSKFKFKKLIGFRINQLYIWKLLFAAQ